MVRISCKELHFFLICFFIILNVSFIRDRKMIRLIKSIFFVVLASMVCLGCSKKKSLSPLSEWMGESKKIKTLSTIAQIGDLVTSIGGERVDNWVLVSSELDPHSYEIVKGDGEKLTRADLVFYNGLGLEHGASLSSQLKGTHKAIALGERIQEAYPERILLREDAVDPHIWMDISLWKEAVPSIIEELSSLDPEGT